MKYNNISEKCIVWGWQWVGLGSTDTGDYVVLVCEFEGGGADNNVWSHCFRLCDVYHVGAKEIERQVCATLSWDHNVSIDHLLAMLHDLCHVTLWAYSCFFILFDKFAFVCQGRLVIIQGEHTDNFDASNRSPVPFEINLVKVADFWNFIYCFGDLLCVFVGVYVHISNFWEIQEKRRQRGTCLGWSQHYVMRDVQIQFAGLWGVVLEWD